MVEMTAEGISQASSILEGAVVPAVGRYALLEKLGAGGMGVVYRVRDPASGRELALKQLLSSAAGERRKKLEALFEREFQTLIRLRHPRIIEVYDYGLGEAGPYYTMELLAGDDLSRVSPLPYTRACAYLRDVASSLALVHAHRLVHRDVSPRNVRLTPDGRAKLIDFGALAGFGLARDMVGTPAYLAPESLLQMPLDQRTDLFALGAVAYFALTGRQAYPARRFEELNALWRRPPPAPSTLVPEIPPELDALVLALLSTDRLSRPASAAVVIDALTSIATLPAEEHELARESYLASGRLVGRQRELTWVKKRVARALGGHGSEVVIDGAPGAGKTRLLHELGLEAQLSGLTVLKADAQHGAEQFGVATTLALQLLAFCPELAAREGQAHAALLAHLSPELWDRMGRPERAELAIDPNERRARFQAALHAWFMRVAAEQALLLAVDNLQLADEGSAAFLAALGSEARSTRLIVLTTQRTGAEVVAKNAVRALRKRSGRLQLSELSADACEALVKSLFGDVEHCGRVARLVFEQSGGNPQRCMDLVQLLVQRGVARYAGGTWVLPLVLSRDDLPSQLDEIVAVKLASLGAAARSLVEALSVHGRSIAIERCLELGAHDGATQTLAALDELVAAQFLLIESGSYRFEQEAVREAVLAQMDDAQRRAQHLRAAEALLRSAGENLGQRMQAAWQLLRAGEDERGADLLATTGRVFLKREGGAAGSVEEIVQALRAAVEIYERRGRSEHEFAALLFVLVPLGYYCSDWRVTTHYAARAFRLGLKITGLGLGWRLRRLFGTHWGCKLGLWFAQRGFARAPRRALELDLRTAIGSLCAMVPATLATLGSCLDTAGVERIVQMLEPLRLLRDSPLAALMHGWAQGQRFTATGRERESLATFEQLAARLREPHVIGLLGEAHARTMYGGTLSTQALMECYCSSPRALELANEMEGLGLRNWVMQADQVRLLYHVYRGETERVRHYRERVDLFAMQGSATWQLEMFWPAVLLDADVLCADTIAARRAFEQLARRAQDLPSIVPYAKAAQAAYLTLRGELNAAIAIYEDVLPVLGVRRRMSWLPLRSCFAQALNLSGQHARAKQLLLDTLAALDPADAVVAVHVLEARRQLALAEAGLGNHARAIVLIDELLASYGPLENPLLTGLLHKARAEVALRIGDAALFEQQSALMEQRFRSTDNPALIAQCQRLVERAVRDGLVRRAAPEPTEASRTRPLAVERTLAELTAAPDRAEYALQLLVQRAHAKGGYLYLWRDGVMRLAAASAPHEPAQGLETQLGEAAVRLEHQERDHSEDATVIEHPALLSEQAQLAGLLRVMPAAPAEPATTLDLPAPDPDASETIFIHSEAPLRADDRHLTLVLHVREGDHRVVVGGAILELDARRSPSIHPELLDAIAGALHDRGATTTGNTQS